MDVCTLIASGPLDTSTFLLLAGLGLLAIAASFRVEATSTPRTNAEAAPA